MKTFKLSPSSISLIEDCPRCFWLTQHKIWKRPSGIFPSLPSGIDLLLKRYYDEFRDRGELPPEIKDKCKGMRLFGSNESERVKLAIWRNNFKGLSWMDEHGNTLHGAVDNILVTKRKPKLIVLDYKTRGFPLKEDTCERYMDQLDIYTFLLKANNYNTEKYAFLMFYIPLGVNPSGEIVFDKQLIKIPVDARYGKYLFIKAIEILNGECPKNSCEWCREVLPKLNESSN